MLRSTERSATKQALINWVRPPRRIP